MNISDTWLYGLCKGQLAFIQSSGSVTYELGVQPGLAGMRVRLQREEVRHWDAGGERVQSSLGSPQFCKLVTVIIPNLNQEAGL